jgi:hypothetical protein
METMDVWVVGGKEVPKNGGSTTMRYTVMMHLAS